MREREKGGDARFLEEGCAQLSAHNRGVGIVHLGWRERVGGRGMAGEGMAGENCGKRLACGQKGREGGIKREGEGGRERRLAGETVGERAGARPHLEVEELAEARRDVVGVMVVGGKLAGDKVGGTRCDSGQMRHWRVHRRTLRWRYLPKRDELLLRAVLALPNASSTGLVSRMRCDRGGERR